MRATFVKDWDPSDDIHHRLYRCDPGGRLPDYVLVSASDVAGATLREHAACGHVIHPLTASALVCETRIYASDYLGRVASYSVWLWEEKGTLDHEATLRAAGYEPEGFPALALQLAARPCR